MAIGVRRADLRQLCLNLTVVRRGLPGACAPLKHKAVANACVHGDIHAVEMVVLIPVVAGQGDEVISQPELRGGHVVESGDRVASAAGQTGVDRCDVLNRSKSDA